MLISISSAHAGILIWVKPLAGDLRSTGIDRRPGAGMSKKARRAVGVGLVVAGGLLLWLTTATTTGLVLLAAAVILEIAGITLEHRNGR